MLVKEGKQVSRIVVMGSGEPMLNFEAVIGALQFLHQENTLYMSYRNMTISTCGIIPGIEKLAALGIPINLAISLPAAEPELRTELMPVNKGYPFPEVIQAPEAYVGHTGQAGNLRIYFDRRQKRQPYSCRAAGAPSALQECQRQSDPG